MAIAEQSVRKPSRVYLRRGHPGTQGLVLALPFFEGQGTRITDISGWQNHGTYSDASQWGIGPTGPVVSFDETNNVTIPDSPQVETDTGKAMTWMCRIKHDSVNDPRQFFTKDQEYTIYIDRFNNSELNWTTYGSNQDFGNALSSNTWYHVVVGWDQSANKLYSWINGEQFWDGLTQTDSSSATSNDLLLGTNTTSGDWAGDMSDFRIYNRILSHGEVQYHYYNPLGIYITKPR